MNTRNNNDQTNRVEIVGNLGCDPKLYPFKKDASRGVLNIFLINNYGDATCPIPVKVFDDVSVLEELSAKISGKRPIHVRAHLGFNEWESGKGHELIAFAENVQLEREDGELVTEQVEAAAEPVQGLDPAVLAAVLTALGKAS